MREKIEIPVNEALPMLAEMIKLKYVTDELGRSSGWIYQKMHYKQVKTTSKGFNESDISSLNEVFERIGEKLLRTQISEFPNWDDDTYSEGETIPEQLKSLSKVINMSYIYVGKLGKDTDWFSCRISTPKRYRFNEEHIMLINLGILEIGKKLLSIKVTL